MSITIHIFYTGENGSANRFVKEMEEIGTADLIRAEDGNLRYEYFVPIHDPETVLLIDSWKDQRSLDIHHASPMMNTIAALREKYGLRMKVERYITDENGFTDNDKQYIKE